MTKSLRLNYTNVVRSAPTIAPKILTQSPMDHPQSQRPASVGTSRNIAITQTEVLKEDVSTGRLLNDEKISQHLVESIEAPTFEKEQDLLDIAFKELEVRLVIFDIFFLNFLFLVVSHGSV